MAISSLTFDYSTRLLIPVWRSFSDALKMNELDSSGKKVHQNVNASTLLADWAEQPSIALASEIISAGATIGNRDFAEYKEARVFLEDRIIPSSSLESLLQDHANALGSNSAQSGQFELLLEDVTVNTIERIWSRLSLKSRHEQLRHAKMLSNKQLANPIVWVDTARLYTVEGQYEKAERCMRIALSIDPNNRFTLRAATALFVHLGDTSQAIHYLRRTTRTKYDPWLISAHIAASSSIGRFSPFLKEGRLMLLDNQVSAANITELASSVGTEELQSGAIKKSHQYFQLALKMPNENTLAQREWVSLKDNRFPFSPAGYQKLVPHPFEANAFDSLQNGHWESAVLYAVKWFLDSPYNRLAVLLCVYLLINLFEKHAEAITFCRDGLRIHHDDPAILNNMIYCYALLGRQSEITSLIKKFKSKASEDRTPSNRIAYLATLGLLAFRDGKIQEGRDFYETALIVANQQKDEVRASEALINFAREIVIADEPDKNEFITRVSKIQNNSKITYIIFLSNKFMRQYGSKSDGVSRTIHLPS
jgi:tetratricopeptide (TPR) repeat protein